MQEIDRTWLGVGFARLVLPEDITGKLWPGGSRSAMSRRTSAIGRSSRHTVGLCLSRQMTDTVSANHPSVPGRRFGIIMS